jgi:hypothetical protein
MANWQILNDELYCEPSGAIALMGVVLAKAQKDGLGFERIHVLEGFGHTDDNGNVRVVFSKSFVDWLEGNYRSDFDGDWVLTYNEMPTYCDGWHSSQDHRNRFKATIKAAKVLIGFNIGYDEETDDDFESEWFAPFVGWATNDMESGFCDLFVSDEFIEWLKGDSEHAYVVEYTPESERVNIEDLLIPVEVKIDGDE